MWRWRPSRPAAWPVAGADVHLRTLAVLAAVALSGCAGGPDGPELPAAGPAVRSAPALLAALPACSPPPPAVDDPVLPELVLLPPGTIVTSTASTGPLLEVQAWTPHDPVAVRTFYEDAHARGPARDLELQQVEDEGVESELLLVGDRGRFHAKSVARCPTESTMYLVVSVG